MVRGIDLDRGGEVVRGIRMLGFEVVGVFAGLVWFGLTAGGGSHGWWAGLGGLVGPGVVEGW